MLEYKQVKVNTLQYSPVALIYTVPPPVVRLSQKPAKNPAEVAEADTPEHTPPPKRSGFETFAAKAASAPPKPKGGKPKAKPPDQEMHSPRPCMATSTVSPHSACLSSECLRSWFCLTQILSMLPSKKRLVVSQEETLHSLTSLHQTLPRYTHAHVSFPQNRSMCTRIRSSHHHCSIPLPDYY